MMQDKQKEIEHFENTDWYRINSTEELKPDSIKRQLSHLIKTANITSETKVLEIACGGGIWGVELLKAVNCSYTGLDLSKSLLDNCRIRMEKAGFKSDFVLGDASNLPFEDNSFDLCFVSYSLHHFPSTQSLNQVTKEAYRILKPGGIYYTYEPNGLCPLVFHWWITHSPERILPLGKKWRENKRLSINETIIYPWQVSKSLKTKFPKVTIETNGFLPYQLKSFFRSESVWNGFNTILEKIPLVNLFGGSFTTIGYKL